MQGLMWLDASAKKSVAEKIKDALNRFYHKYGLIPTVCYVHLSIEPIEVYSVRVVPAKNVPEHHYYVTRED